MTWNHIIVYKLFDRKPNQWYLEYTVSSAERKHTLKPARKGDNLGMTLTGGNAPVLENVEYPF